MYCAATFAAITWICDVARDEWTANVRAASVIRRATCQSNNPPRRMNGSSVRYPDESGGNSRARVLAK
eukprot:1851230-Pleurochrysis_carterae.AAC.1